MEISNLRDKYLEHLGKKNYSNEDIENIKVMCDEVSEQLKNSNGLSQTGAGLLVGEVQSGKTSNFFALTLDQFDKDNFDIVIILGGVIRDLMNQTSDRIVQFSNPSSSDYEKIDISTDIKTELEEYRETINDLEKPLIIICLKETKNLQILNNMIRGVNKRILIIDDESDQATPNNEKIDFDFYGNKKVSDDLSKIHDQIKELKNSNHYSFLLLVTATPYSNLLASSRYDISPKWGYVLKTGEGYCGLEYFHQEYNDYRDNKIRVLSTFKELDEREGRLTNDLTNATIEEAEWYKKELKNSILSFIVGNEIFRFIEGEDKRFEMLIHSHNKKNDHKKIRTFVENYLNSWLETNDDELKLKEKSIESEIIQFSKQLDSQKADLIKQEKEYLIENVIKIFKNSKKKIWLEINNADNKSFNSNRSFKSNGKDIITIGADKIQRGITFPSLRVVFMPRVAVITTADTILQRARWFGYRGKFAEYMTIFLTERLKWLFNSYVDLKEEINDFLNSHFNDGTNLREIDKYIPVPSNDDFGRLTRKSINLIENDSEKINTIIQKIPVLNFPDEENYIKEIIENDVNDTFKKWKFYTTEIKIDSINKKYLEIIFKKLNYTTNIQKFLDRALKLGIKSITFTLMNFDVENKVLLPRERSLKMKYKEEFNSVPISNLWSGKDQRYNKETDKFLTSYAGDRNILNKYIKHIKGGVELDTMEIQIHNVQPKFNNDKSFEQVYMYSLVLPHKKSISFIEREKVKINE